MSIEPHTLSKILVAKLVSPLPTNRLLGLRSLAQKQPSSQAGEIAWHARQLAPKRMHAMASASQLHTRLYTARCH